MAALVTTSRPSIGVVEVDASVEEMHQSRAQVTRHPIERGGSVADHVQLEPDCLQMTGLVSNHPLEAQAVPELRAESAYAELLRIHADKEAVTVVTSLRTYDDMVLVSLDVPRGVKLDHVLRFQAQFEHITKVSSSLTIDLPEPAVSRAQVKASKGKQPTKPATEEQSTFALNAYNGIVGP